MSKDMRWLEVGNDFLDITDASGSSKKASVVQCLYGGAITAAVLVWDTKAYLVSKYRKNSSQDNPRKDEEILGWRDLG